MIHLSAKDIARELGVSKSTALAVMHEAGAIKFGRNLRLSRENFDAWRSGPKYKFKDNLLAQVMGHCVYFIQCNGDQGPIKIGFTSNLDQRLVMLQAANPYPLKLIRAVPGGKDKERAFHAHFSHLRIHGEWFRYGLELQALIGDLLVELRQ